MPNRATATIRLQKYSSLPWPNGWLASAGLRLFFKPSNRRTWLPVSTAEWMPSESMAELPVKLAATNLVTAMSRLAPMAP
jgi:hypothetical protein